MIKTTCLELHVINTETHVPMLHPIKALCFNVFYHEVLHSHPSYHPLPQTQGSRLLQDPNTNNTQEVNYHIPN